MSAYIEDISIKEVRARMGLVARIWLDVERQIGHQLAPDALTSCQVKDDLISLGYAAYWWVEVLDERWPKYGNG